MKAIAKCLNWDCKKYDVKWEFQTAQMPLLPLYCDHCLIGKLQVHIDLSHAEGVTEDEFISAEFDVLKILKG